MSITSRQHLLLHVVVRDFDRELGAARLDVASLQSFVGGTPEELAADVATLVADGYLDRKPDFGEGAFEPTGKGLLTVMGMEE
jgi:hypothetical protein